MALTTVVAVCGQGIAIREEVPNDSRKTAKASANKKWQYFYLPLDDLSGDTKVSTTIYYVKGSHEYRDCNADLL